MFQPGESWRTLQNRVVKWLCFSQGSELDLQTPSDLRSRLILMELQLFRSMIPHDQSLIKKWKLYGVILETLWVMIYHHFMGVSKNNGIPKSSILIGFSIINHPFWGTIIFENTLILSPGAQEKERTERKSSRGLHRGLFGFGGGLDGWFSIASMGLVSLPTFIIEHLPNVSYPRLPNTLWGGVWFPKHT